LRPWTGPLDDDPLRLPGPATFDTVRALKSAIGTLHEHGQLPFAPPFRLDEAGWVANRIAARLPWCRCAPVVAVSGHPRVRRVGGHERLSHCLWRSARSTA
jgi:hypothetical protein